MLNWLIADFEILGLHIQYWMAAFAAVFAIWMLCIFLGQQPFRKN
jgi:hypothetical protein